MYVVATPFSVAAGETVPHGLGSQETVQVTPLLVGSLATLATIWAAPPACTSPVLCESMETVVPGTRKLTPFAAEESVTEVAVITTFKSPVGSVVGAVYVTGVPLAVAAGEIVPHGGEPQSTAHVTPLFAGSLATVAVNCAVVPTGTVAGVGVTETVIGSGVTVAVAEADAALAVTEVALILTIRLLVNALVGAVYVAATPLAVAAGETDPHGAAEHDTVQVTPLFDESLMTVAVTCTEPPAGTVDGSSATETVTGTCISLVVLLLPLPPQPATATVRTSSSQTREENVECFTTPPCGQPEWRAGARTTPNIRMLDLPRTENQGTR